MKFGNIRAVQFLGQLFPSERWLDNKLFLTDYDYGWIETAQGRDVVNFGEWIVSGPDGIRKLYSHEFEEEFGEIEEIPLTNRESSRKSSRAQVWCRCDLSHISLTEKCSVCGGRINRKKIKLKI